MGAGRFAFFLRTVFNRRSGRSFRPLGVPFSGVSILVSVDVKPFSRSLLLSSSSGDLLLPTKAGACLSVFGDRGAKDILDGVLGVIARTALVAVLRIVFLTCHCRFLAR